MTKKKYLLVRYTNVNGEQEYCGHSVLVVHPRKKNENAVHEHFMDFWGAGQTDKEDCKKCQSYMYGCGYLAVDDIRWEEITEAQYNVLKEVHLAH